MKLSGTRNANLKDIRSRDPQPDDSNELCRSSGKGSYTRSVCKRTNFEL